MLYNNSFFSTEHSLEVQLPFLQLMFDKFTFSVFLTGGYVNYHKCAEYFMNNYANSILIISSDLSHQLPLQQANAIDQKTINAVLSQEFDYFLNQENVACGVGGITIVMELARINGWKSKLIFYDTSYTNSGDQTQVVGYTSIAFY